MSTLLIVNADLSAAEVPLGRGWLQVAGEKIVALGSGAPPDAGGARVIDAGGRAVLPGFIDLHVHGAGGFDAMDGQVESLRAMSRIFARHGVTAFLPTTWTASSACTRRALETIAAAVGPQPEGASILGAHLEGPYLNPAKCGAQQVDQIRRADRSEALPWLDLGVIRLLALAPEYPENAWLIEECSRRGVTVSAAHTQATFQQMSAAVALGLRQTTHTFNAMSPLHHREPGTVGAALCLPELRCELIMDTLHVHPALCALLHRCKGPDGVILISDAVGAAGLPDGPYQFDGRPVTLQNGAIRLPDGTLAGSALMMDQALRNFCDATGQAPAQLWRSSSLNAARAIGLDHRTGSLAPGKDADLVILNPRVEVQMTVARGRVVFAQAPFSSHL